LIKTPRLDNAYALILISNKKDGYRIIGPDKTGVYIDGNAKSVKLFKHTITGKVFEFIATNNNMIEFFDFNNARN